MTVKIVAKKRKSVTRAGRFTTGAWSQRAQQLRQLLRARAAREAMSRLRRQLDRGQAAVLEALVQARERLLQRLDVVGRRRSRRLRSRGSTRRRRRRAAPRRGSAARPRGTRTPSRESTPRPRPPASGIRSSSASESRCSSSDVRRGAYGTSSKPVAEPERLRPLAVGRAEVADEARLDVEPRLGERRQERPRVALAEEAAGVGDPEAQARAGTRARRSRRSRSRSRSSRRARAARAAAPPRRSRPRRT